jgi:molybdopterin converting factor small subunit
MAKIIVRLYSLFQQLAKIDAVHLEANDIEEAMKQLELKFGPKILGQLKANKSGHNGRLREYCILLVNGHSVNKEEFDRIKLTSGDILHLFPLVPGG